MTNTVVREASPSSTLGDVTVQVEAPALPFRMFAVQVAAVQPMCPSVVRVTFTGDDLDRFADNGFDQRIKFFLPLDTVPYDELLSLQDSADWYGRWRAMPDEKRHPIRTYTARGVRQERREVDVDIVLHGDLGPASRWALGAAPGDDLVILGPNADATGPHGGVDFVPPAHTDRLLIAGDETALPAISRILATAAANTRGLALVEVAGAQEEQPLDAPAGVKVRWLHRGTAAPGGNSLLAEAVAALDRPEGDDLFAWVAAESAAVRAIRADLRGRWGLGRAQHHAIGYWRRGRAMAPAG